MSFLGIPIHFLDEEKPVPGAVPPTQPAEVAAGAKPSTPDFGTIPSLHLPQGTEDAMQQVGAFSGAALTATIGAAEKNAPLLTAAEQLQDQNYTDVLKADENLKRINRFPHAISRVLGLFDEDWNPASQAMNIEMANVKTQQGMDRLKLQMQVNDMLPTTLKEMGKVADDLFAKSAAVETHKLDVYKVGQEDRRIAQAGQGLALERIRTGLAVDAASREKMQFKVNAMGLDDKMAAIDQLKKNPKDPNRWMLGMLEEGVFKEKTAIAGFRAANAAAEKGEREEADKQLQIATDHLPLPVLEKAAQWALKNGSPTVTFGKGTKSEQKVPVQYVINSMQTVQANEQKAQDQLAGKMAEDTNIGQRTSSLANSAGAMTQMDPRAGGVMAVVKNSVGQLQKNPSPEQLSMHEAVIKQQEARMKEIAGDVAKQFRSPEAQAAVQKFAASGKFDRVGAQAIVTDTIGNQANYRTALYAPAFASIGRAVAGKLQQQNNFGGAGIIGNGTSDIEMEMATSMQILAGSLKNPNLQHIKEAVMSDPAALKDATAIITTQVSKDTLTNSINSLARSKGQSPVWTDMLRHQDVLVSPKPGGGYQLDPNKIAEHLEQMKTMTGGKVDYPAALLTAMRAEAAQADQTAGMDPRRTLIDNALEHTIFGDSPHAAIAGDFVNKLSKAMNAKHDEMQARIKKDVSGQTVEQAQFDQAIREHTPYGPAAPIGGKVPPFDPAKVKSATGTNLTAQQMSSLYGGQ